MVITALTLPTENPTDNAYIHLVPVMFAIISPIQPISEVALTSVQRKAEEISIILDYLF
jgi:hypothetical protein